MENSTMKTTLLRMKFYAIIVSSLLLNACGNASPLPEPITELTVTPAATPTARPLPFTPTPSPALIPMEEFMKGISYVQWDRGGFTSQASDILLGQSIP